jgi:excisionase family DNA binding protein
MPGQARNADQEDQGSWENNGPIRPLLLTVPEAAALLSVGRTTLYELIGSGEISVVHIGRSCRVPVEAIYEFVSAKRSLR